MSVLMLQVKTKNKFEKDFKRMHRRGKNLEKLRSVMKSLVGGEPLSKQRKDHSLVGNYSGCRECHIEPDWLLIYFLSKTAITFVRTGSHADLFR